MKETKSYLVTYGAGAYPELYEASFKDFHEAVKFYKEMIAERDAQIYIITTTVKIEKIDI